MKYKQLKNITISLAVALAFFLGRESKTLLQKKALSDDYYGLENNLSSNFTNSKKLNSNKVISLNEKFDSVYRCGKSKIYHPTTTHASFKKCKSSITKISIQRAKNIGMRHCKCNG